MFISPHVALLPKTLDTPGIEDAEQPGLYDLGKLKKMPALFLGSSGLPLMVLISLRYRSFLAGTVAVL